MKAFIGLCFAMGVLCLPARSDYWRTSKWLFVTSFNKIMPRDRFNQIWRYLQLQNNEMPPPPDRLWKIRWYLDYLNNKFSQVYVPYENVTIDESMVKFKGRLSFRQYLPAKPIKWGVKIWNMAESDTGYMYRFQVYTRKEGRQEKGLTHRVVMDLRQPILGQNLHVFMDNFYTSPELLQDLHVRGVQACGTVRSNRKGLPKDLLPSKVKLDKHEYKVAQKDELTYSIWMDTKPVIVLSNFHDPSSRHHVNRRVANGGPVEVPMQVSDYQKYMKGVDLCDQMVGYYLLQHRSKKWWRRIFFYLLLASAHNSYVVAKDTNGEHVRKEWPNFQDFVEGISEGLIGNVRAKKEVPLVELPTGGRLAIHNIEKIFDKKKVCRECSLSAQRGQRRALLSLVVENVMLLCTWNAKASTSIDNFIE